MSPWKLSPTPDDNLASQAAGNARVLLSSVARGEPVRCLPMKAIRVRVENGRITGDAPAGLPDGEIDLCLADTDDEMNDEDLARLNESLRRGLASIEAGRFRSASDVIADLRRR